VPLVDPPGILGVGGSYWADLLRGHSRTRKLFDAAVTRGLARDWSGAGAEMYRPSAVEGQDARGEVVGCPPTMPRERRRASSSGPVPSTRAKTSFVSESKTGAALVGS
jgi:hypothetical protein